MAASAAAVWLVAAFDGRAATTCEPWPGEPAPLATTRDEDPFRARWAMLRADELAQIALPLELVSRVDAHRLWIHIRCLDAAHAAAQSGLARTAPVRVHHPDVSAGALVAPDPADDLVTAFERLGRSVRVALPRVPAPVQVTTPAPVAPPVRPPPPVDLGEPTRLAAEADAAMRQARFEDALGTAARARDALPAGATGATANALRARIEASAGAASVALGKEDEARASFVRALRADPAFRLDPKSTSPKVMRSFDAARSAQGAP